MQKLSLFPRLSYALLCLFLGSCHLSGITANRPPTAAKFDAVTCQHRQLPNFLVVAGGGSRASNEIALEKNVLYFQRTLKNLGHNPDSATLFFANGNNGQATIRYIDRRGQERFKPPEIPNLQGSATWENMKQWFEQQISDSSNRPIFFYFTGHGLPNSLILWQDRTLSVDVLANQLDRLSEDTPVVMMMAQCYSGSFANFIYEGGDPSQPVALHTRCGFFATVETRPSVGCTPLVNEADYQDYSSSFFAGLSGITRIGESAPSADYNTDGRVSYAEAHAFAKVDEQTMDWPISTSEAWLQKQATETDLTRIFDRPIANLLSNARPEQQYVIDSLMKAFDLDKQQSLTQNFDRVNRSQVSSDVDEAYLMRLQMEVVNIGMEAEIRTSGSREAIATLDRLLKCESGSWQ